jgi:DNA-binding transcriptional regulator YiaG
MRSFETWMRKQLKNPAVKKEYDALEDEFAALALGTELLKARTRAKLTQAQVARRMGTSQSAVARLESGRAPSLASLRKYAKATGSKIEIKLKAG